MSRKAERTLAWIAISLSLIYLLFMVIAYNFINVPEFKEVFNEMNQQQGTEITPGAFKASIVLQGVFTLISTILAIIAVFTIKGNRILAGCLFIVSAIIGISGGNFIAMILWLIVGIMLFAKKDNTKQGNQINQMPNYNIYNNEKEKQKPQQQDMDPEAEMKRKKDDDPYIY
ncbi:MAG: DUF4064 domain-containing protein [Staphylococcus equorum]|uniref:DUF4064 domain-containing protein n=1 Tax=Staphylococcus TaxID=1279 RepID=UPI000852A8D3|nr:DUF4064 domain-containing protein [Staphylococcus equorum]MDG0821469.1 DUF4064 domain-containing protein [Staphylococcus equorum]MDG0837686.1 DUF4064 domain-containing protein [Staphylococcus equorum]MDK9870357.1 DUF4064 domain-containing protein [Staphylococcus equorum]MDK9876644.1 DUF4064 domain-containing protein [Staphylococcus equorum]MDN5828387.1 DUF4064 domain-containing protein [Staphylococcus equorum]